MADCPPRLPKPLMRGLLARDMKKSIIQAVVLALAAAGSYKVLVADVRRKRYADFYKDYDAEADYQRMRSLGLFQSG